MSYTLPGQTDTVTLPATGQTGTGRARKVNGYLYVGGPLTTVTSYDESDVQVRQVTNTYGLEGKSLSVTGSTEPVTNTYDALYRVKTLKDGNNNTTTYAYNNIGLLSLITMPGGETTQFPSYDNAGNLLQRIDGKGVVTNYVYNDAENRLTDIQYPASTSLNVHFGYDTFGRRSSMTDGTGSQSYSYGNLDELLSRTTTYTGLSAQTISYAYYPNGSRQTMTTPAGTFNYNFDAAGRPASIINPFSETTGWSYQDNDWRQTQTLSNGAITTYTYNAAGQMTRLLNQFGGSTLSDFTSVGYDGVGNRTSITASVPGLAAHNGVTSYQYDTKDQLTQEQSTRNGGFTESFGFDAAGNPTSFKGATKAYNSSNQQTGTGFAYDGNGNPTTYKSITLTFDPEDRLTAYGTTATAGYGGDGLRAWKQAAGATTYFLYDGIAPVVELDQTGAVTAVNTFGGSGLLSRRANASSVFYTFDPQGNVSERTNNSGVVLSHYLFDAHGSSLNGALTEPFGYKAQWGYYTDIETGLHLLANRYYDSSTGRFLTRDPISYGGGINLYAYTGNNTVNLADPLGLQGGPVNYLRDPFSSDYWLLNAASNTLSDFLSLDAIAGWSWTAGNHCLPTSERASAAAKGLGTTAVVAFSGPILKRVGGALISALSGRAAAGAPATTLLGTARDNLLKAATNPRLRDAIDNLYREGATMGNGSSMDALRIEGSHLIKVLGRRTQLMRIRSGEILNSTDRQILREILVTSKTRLAHI